MKATGKLATFILGIAAAAPAQLPFAQPATAPEALKAVDQGAPTATATDARSLPVTDAERKRDLEDFLQARVALAAEMNAVRQEARKAGDKDGMQAMEQWHRANSPRLEAVQQLAARIAASRPAIEPPLITSVAIPADASPELEEFLVERAHLYNQGVVVGRRMAAAPAEAATVWEEWSKAQTAASDTLGRRLQALQAQTPVRVMEVPPAPLIPQDASPELAAFLTERHSLLKERVEVERRAILEAKETREEAVARWLSENKIRLERNANQAASLPEK